MFDDLSFVDDKDCSGDCFKCPYAIKEVIGGLGGDTYPVSCKLEEGN